MPALLAKVVAPPDIPSRSDSRPISLGTEISAGKTSPIELGLESGHDVVQGLARVLRFFDDEQDFLAPLARRKRSTQHAPLHPFRAECTRLNCVQLYTNAAFDSNLNSTPAVGSRNSNGDDCAKQRGRSQEEVDQDSFSGSRRHHQFAECPLREVVILKLWGSQTVWSL